MKTKYFRVSKRSSSTKVSVFHRKFKPAKWRKLGC